MTSKGFRLPNGWHGWRNDDGRGSLYLCSFEEAEFVNLRNRVVSWEVAFPSSFKAIGFGFTTDDEDGKLGVYLGPLSAYLSVSALRHRGYKRREVDAYVSFTDAVAGTLNIWTDSFDSSNPRQYRFSSWRLKNRVLGKSRRTVEHVSTHQVDIVIPGDPTPYPCRVTLERWTYQRDRWPVKRTFDHADVEVLSKGGIPYEGKGENAWDCGTDATFSLSCSARTVGDAVGKMVATIVDERLRHGWDLPVAEREGV